MGPEPSTPAKGMLLPVQLISKPCCCRAKKMTNPEMAMAQEKAVEVILRVCQRKFTIRYRGGHSLVVLGPPAQVASPDVVVEGNGNGDGGPNVGHVVRRPNEPTNQEDGNVEVRENLELLAKEVKGDR